jgi:hypothetical protein
MRGLPHSLSRQPRNQGTSFLQNPYVRLMVPDTIHFDGRAVRSPVMSDTSYDMHSKHPQPLPLCVGLQVVEITSHTTRGRTDPSAALMPNILHFVR